MNPPLAGGSRSIPSEKTAIDFSYVEDRSPTPFRPLENHTEACANEIQMVTCNQIAGHRVRIPLRKLIDFLSSPVVKSQVVSSNNPFNGQRQFLRIRRVRSVAPALPTMAIRSAPLPDLRAGKLPTIAEGCVRDHRIVVLKDPQSRLPL